jgi:hypothetical protein
LQNGGRLFIQVTYGQSVNYATTAGFMTDPTKLPLGGIMSGLIQSTSTEF